MKKLIILIPLAFILFFGCSDFNFETGIKASVVHGQGDCMPVIDYQNREYNNYKGTIFFIVKEDLDSLGSGDFDQLKNNSISLAIKRGKLSTELPCGTYLVMTEDHYLYAEENMVTIKPGEVLLTDFKFWKCTSY